MTAPASRNLSLDFDALPQVPPRDHEPHGARALSKALTLHGQSWLDMAQALYLAYGLRCAGRAFLTEEAVAYAHHHGLPLPPDGRAWGGVVTRLRRADQIRSQGHALAHDGSPKTLWRLTAPTYASAMGQHAPGQATP